MIDQDGNEFVIQNGNKKIISQGKHLPTIVNFDEFGNIMVFSDDGKPIQV